MNSPYRIFSKHRTKTSRGLLSAGIALVLLFLHCVPAGHAGTYPSSYNAGDLSFQFLAGVLSSPAPLVVRTDVFNYAQMNLRLGRIFADFDHCGGSHKSAIEGLVEFTNSWIFNGYGNYLSGATLLLRYNFVTAGSRFVPYAQAGVGVVHTDAYRDTSQTAIGESIEFTPQGSLGFHCFIGEKWSLDGEVILQHISNAGLDERNGGINSVGGFLGATYYFDATPE